MNRMSKTKKNLRARRELKRKAKSAKYKENKPDRQIAKIPRPYAVAQRDAAGIEAIATFAIFHAKVQASKRSRTPEKTSRIPPRTSFQQKTPARKD